jgi:hypothetical protein
MLDILVLAYGPTGQPPAAPIGQESLLSPPAGQPPGPHELRRHVLEAFTHRTLRQGGDSAYPAGQTRRWLAWLAGQTAARNQRIFLVEQLQPDWLPAAGWRWLYRLAAWLVTGLAGALLMALTGMIVERIGPPLPAVLAESVAARLPVSLTAAKALLFLAGNAGLALVAGLIQGLFDDYHARRRAGAAAAPKGWRRVALIGAVTGGLTTAGLAPFGRPLLALSWGVAEAFYFMTVSRYVHGLGHRLQIRTVEALDWSWPGAGRGLLFGLLLTTAAELLETALYGYNGVVRSLLTFGTGGLLLGGLTGRSLKEQNSDGMLLSLRNALLAGLLAAGTLGGLTWLLRDLGTAGLVALWALLFAGVMYGAGNVALHLLLRLILWAAGCLPWRLGRFLDHAAGLGLLRKVGDGYIFFHPLLQQHLAEQE